MKNDHFNAYRGPGVQSAALGKGIYKFGWKPL
jgi:hypothetical protein